MQNLHFNFQGVGKQVSSYQTDYLVVNPQFSAEGRRRHKNTCGNGYKSVVRNQKSQKWKATAGQVMLKSNLREAANWLLSIFRHVSCQEIACQAQSERKFVSLIAPGHALIPKINTDRHEK